jgi:hypothetical protein
MLASLAENGFRTANATLPARFDSATGADARLAGRCGVAYDALAGLARRYRCGAFRAGRPA